MLIQSANDRSSTNRSIQGYPVAAIVEAGGSDLDARTVEATDPEEGSH